MKTGAFVSIILVLHLSSAQLAVGSSTQQQQQQQSYVWTSLAGKLAKMKTGLLEATTNKLTNFTQGFVEMPNTFSPVDELISYVRNLIRTVENACRMLSDWHDEAVTKRCHEDVVTTVCSTGYLLNGTFAKVSGQCDRLSSEYARQKCQEEVNRKIFANLWALKFIDSIGKIPSGVFEGNLFFLGSYEECNEVIIPRIDENFVNVGAPGRHCSLMVNFPEFPDFENMADILFNQKSKQNPIVEPFLKWSFCAPSTCNTREVEYLSVLAFPNATWDRLHVSCEEQSRLVKDSGALLSLSLSALWAVAIITASSYDVWLNWNTSKKRQNRNSFTIEDAADDDVSGSRSNCVQWAVNNETATNRRRELFLSLSLYRSFNRLTREEYGHLPFVNGIRVLSMLYAIFGYSTMYAVNGVDNALASMKMIGEFKSQIINSAAWAADSFFLLSGCLVCYWFVERMKSRTVPSSVQWMLLFVRRLFRLLPLYFVILICTTTLFKHFGNGPLWTGSVVMESSEEACQHHWWTGLLLLQNFLYSHQPCFGWTWFLAVDVQLFICAPILLWLFYSRPRWAFALATISATLLAICNVIIIVCNDYPPAYVGTMNLHELKKIENYARNVFNKPHAHACAYVIGLALGYTMFRFKSKRFRIPSIAQNLLWCVIVGINMATVFSTQDYAKGLVWSLVIKGIYVGLTRLMWPLTVAALCLWCMQFPDSTTNNILAMNIWQPLSRLTYGVALVHPLVISCLLLTHRETFHISTLNVIYNGISVTAMSYLISFSLYMAIEAPCLSIRDHWFPNRQFLDKASMKI